MPHLVIEYAPDLADQVDIAMLCGAAHAAMAANPLFPLAGIRVRAYPAAACVVADGLAENSFVAMTLAVGAGRNKADLQAAGAAIFAAVQAALAGPLAGDHFALSLYIREIDPDLSWKDNPIHARLKGKR
jgi:5-carboxymethyl-2-hydroxymuconate isomerase